MNRERCMHPTTYAEFDLQPMRYGGGELCSLGVFARWLWFLRAFWRLWERDCFQVGEKVTQGHAGFDCWWTESMGRTGPLSQEIIKISVLVRLGSLRSTHCHCSHLCWKFSSIKDNSGDLGFGACAVFAMELSFVQGHPWSVYQPNSLHHVLDSTHN